MAVAVSVKYYMFHYEKWLVVIRLHTSHHQSINSHRENINFCKLQTNTIKIIEKWVDDNNNYVDVYKNI